MSACSDLRHTHAAEGKPSLGGDLDKVAEPMYLYSELTEQERQVWDAYTRLAAEFGRQDTENPENFAQSNFSLWWYFQTVRGNNAQTNNALVNNAQVNDLLRAVLSGAKTVPDPDGEGAPDWAAVMERTVRPKLKQNPSQYRAVSVALTQPISFIQGPPGTGKTETILNLLDCIVAEGKTAAIVSANNAAVENVIEKVKSKPDRPTEWGVLAARLARLGRWDYRVEFTSRLDHTPHPFRFGPTSKTIPTGSRLSSETASP